MRSEALEAVAGGGDIRSDRAEAKYFRLQYLRAVAALAVVLFHAAYYLKLTRGDDRLLAVTPANLGGFGVCLFFVISGYLMASLANKTPPTYFIVHRIIRIYPIYWLALIGMFAASALLGHGLPLDPLAIVLLPGDHRSYVLGVEWTLPFELSFYLVIFLIMAARSQRALPIIAILWGAAIVALTLLYPYQQQDQFPRLAPLLVSAWTLPFVVGLLLPTALRLGLIGRWAWMPGIALIFVMFVAPDVSAFLPAVGCFFVVGWAVAPRPSILDADRIKLLTRFGDWSYALYLCHVPVIVLIYNKSPAYANDALLYGVGVAAALAASSIVGRVDLLLYGALKHRADQSGPAFRYALSSAFAIITLAYGGYAELAAATRQEAKMIPSPPNATVVAVRVLNEDERQRK
jgi:exopolysaccharide production protein ExoZ